MSREIKFRIWDNDKDEWLSQSDDDALTYYGFHLIGECMTVQSPSKWTVNGTVEQYTGLKDKNGKEIYEGDIVNLAYYEKPHDKKRWNKTYPHKGGKDINVVSFEDGYFKFHQEDKDGYGSELAFSDYGEWESRDCEYKYEAEVIGNIHENKELLEGKK